MVTLEEVTVIHAPLERCFDLARSIDLHLESTAGTGEQAIAGVVSGLIGLNEEVTWRARQLGRWRQMTVRVTALDPPRHFRDRMVRGPFRLFEHDHYFAVRGGGLTAMKDTLRYGAPLPGIGLITEQMLKSHLTDWLRLRNQLLLRVAESEEWQKYLPGVSPVSEP